MILLFVKLVITGQYFRKQLYTADFLRYSRNVLHEHVKNRLFCLDFACRIKKGRIDFVSV